MIGGKTTLAAHIREGAGLSDPGRNRYAVRHDPAYLEFFGFGMTAPDELLGIAKVSY
jgi:hypothetical protein